MRCWFLTSIVIAGLLGFVCPAFSTPADIAYFHTEILTIKKKGNSYSLKSEVEIQKRLLSERAAENPVDRIDESYFSTIDDIKASYDQGTLGKHQIQEMYKVRHDAFFNEERYWLLHWPAVVGVGSRLWLRYEEDYKNLAFLPAIYVPNINEVREFVLRFNHPKDLTLDFECFFPRGEIPYEIQRPSPTETALIFGTILYDEPLPYFDFNHFHCAILTRFRRAEELVNPVDVPNFCRWYWDELDFEPDFLPDQAAALTEQFAGDRDRLRDISDYVRDNYRYVLDVSRSHSIWPKSPSVMENVKYGDCKDRAYLVRAIGLLEGLNVHMATISHDPEVPFDGTHASLFDHIICAADSDTGLVFFDPTAKFHAFGTLAESLVGRRAVILDPSNPRRIEIPNSFPEPKLDIVIRAQPDNLPHCPATIVASGEFKAAIEQARFELTPARFEECLDELLTERLINLELDSFVIISETEQELTLSAFANLTRFLVVSSRRVYLPQTPFMAVKPEILSRESDSLPIAFDARQDWKLTLLLGDPGLQAKALAIDFKGGEQVSYAADARQLDGDTARFVYHLRRGIKYYHGEARTELLRFCRNYLEARNQMFTIEGVKE
jgi:hypothetical protein